MKLVRESHEKGEIDVLQFLVQDAGPLGIHINLSRRHAPLYEEMDTSILPVESVPDTL